MSVAKQWIAEGSVAAEVTRRSLFSVAPDQYLQIDPQTGPISSRSDLSQNL